MKLRNKKTGDIRNVWVYYEGDKDMGVLNLKYNSLAELNEEWEDCQAPIIKDEKIRNVVRAWAEANNLNNVAFEDYDDENCYFIDGDYEPQIWFSKKSILESPLDDGKIYTIAELCGEEEG